MLLTTGLSGATLNQSLGFNLKCITVIVSGLNNSNIRKGDYVFIINPKGGKGKVGKEWTKISPNLDKYFTNGSTTHELFTENAQHATELTREAVEAQAAAVIAVGGDGTLHQVVNGFFTKGEPVVSSAGTVEVKTAIGLIPLGTGSDFARSFGWKNNDAEAALQRIAEGNRKLMDVGHITCLASGAEKAFLNVADIHLSARTGMIAEKYKFLGTLCYVVGTILAFFAHRNANLKIKIDDKPWVVCKQLTMAAIANAEYFGAGMRIAPGANPSSGLLKLVILAGFQWYHFLMHVPKLFAGSHYELKGVTHTEAKSVLIDHVSSEELSTSVLVEADGEQVGYLPARFVMIAGGVHFLG